MKNTPIQCALKEILHRHFAIGDSPESIEDDFDFLTSGTALDSVELLELAIAIEQRFHLTLSSEDVSIELFSSLPSLTRFITSRIQDASI